MKEYTKEQAEFLKRFVNHYANNISECWQDYNSGDMLKHIDDNTEPDKGIKLAVTVKVEGFEALKKTIDKLDMEKVIKDAIKKATEPELNPCPFCGEYPYRFTEDRNYARCLTPGCAIEKVSVKTKNWNRRA